MSKTITVNGKEYINGTKYTLNDDGTFVCEDGRILYYACDAKDKEKLKAYHSARGKIYGISDPQRNAEVYGDIEYALKMFDKGVIVDGDLYLDRGDAEFDRICAQSAGADLSDPAGGRLLLPLRHRSVPARDPGRSGANRKFAPVCAAE